MAHPIPHLRARLDYGVLLLWLSRSPEDSTPDFSQVTLSFLVSLFKVHCPGLSGL